MKKTYLLPPMTKRQAEGFGRNYSSMSKKKKRKIGLHIFLLLTSGGRIPKGKLGFKRTTADAKFLFNAKAIHSAIAADTGGFYTPAFPLLALLLTQCTTFDTAIQNVKARKYGSEGAKTAAKKSLWKTLVAALAYINELARLNERDAVEIITGAKMIMAGASNPSKNDFAVKQGNSATEILLISRAVKKEDGSYAKATYEWQFSIDNGVTWEYLPPTLVSKTTATEMAPGLATKFRKRTYTRKDGFTDWCDPLEIIPQ